jgi:hypothetical protein
MSERESRHDISERVVDQVIPEAEKLNAVRSARCKVGGEQFHGEIGHYFRQHRITLRGDTDSEQFLKAVSYLCDKHGLEVDEEKGHTFAGEDY